MAKLIYSAAASLDGYVADRDGKWDWSRPDEEVHSFINHLARPLRTHLYGRRMYEVLSVWEDLDLPDQPGYIAEFAEIWHNTDKIVFSRTLQDVSTSRTRLERNFAPETIRELKATADTDLAVGGPELAGQAMQAGLVDEIHLFVAPAVVGGGKRVLSEGVRLDLELLEQRGFRNGTVHLHYRVVT
jgi:dihydrofolate reductase